MVSIQREVDDDSGREIVVFFNSNSLSGLLVAFGRDGDGISSRPEKPEVVSFRSADDFMADLLNLW